MDHARVLSIASDSYWYVSWLRSKPRVGRVPADGSPHERRVSSFLSCGLREDTRPRAQALRPGKSAPSLDALRTRRRSPLASVSCCTSRRCGLATQPPTSCERVLLTQTSLAMAVESDDRVELRRQRYSVSYSTSCESRCGQQVLQASSPCGVKRAARRLVERRVRSGGSAHYRRPGCSAIPLT
jgi:hypothetical protein